MGDLPVSGAKELALIVLPMPEPAEITNQLRKRYPTIEFMYMESAFVQGMRSSSDMPEISDELWAKITILVTLITLPPRAEVVPNLKFIQLSSAGVNHIVNHPIYTDSDLPIATASGIHGPMISEWVVLQMLIHSHRAKEMLEWQRESKWTRSPAMQTRHDYVGKRLAVLGYGSIGRQVGRVAKAMGMDVIAFTASPRTTPESRYDHGYVVPGTGDLDGSIPSAWFSGLDKKSLREFLSQDIDVLVVSVPLTKESHHMLGADELAILGKTNALLVNIARGEIIDQDAMIAALKKPRSEGGLGGAALDVTTPEPLPSDSELWRLENVTITPHLSGLGEAYYPRAIEVFETNVDNLMAGKKLINVVNRKRGY